VGSWAEHRLKLPIPGHLVALRAAGKPPADVVAQLATLGHFDACVLVVSLHQVLSEGERALLHAASSLGIVARILVVAVPGEEPTADDLAQLTALGRRCLLNAGFQGDRAGDVGLWFTDGAPRKNTVSNVASFLSVDPAAVAAGRAAWANQSLVALVTELAEHAKKTASPSVPLVEEKDQDRLTTELDSFLTDLGKRLERDLAKRPMAADRVRREVIEAIRGWSAYLGMEGSWMKLVDRLRPGAQKALQTEVEAGVAELEFEPGRAPTIATPAAPPDRTTMLATRIIVALAAGVGMYAVTAWALSEVAGQMATTAPVTDGAPAAALAAPLPEPVRMAVSVAALLAGSVLGFAFSGRFFAQTAPQAVAPATTAQLHGWPQFQRRLTTWFRQYIGSRPALPAEECVAWLARLGASPESRS
ncbi:MAG TPA: hypothetical protein VGE52_04105, partial [Pirellulales bacterium]